MSNQQAKATIGRPREVDDVVVVGAARTPVGSYDKALRGIPAHELGSLVIRAALDRADVAATDVDEVVMGQVGQVGPDAYNARRCALHAGLSVSTTAQTVNRLCGSGLQAIWTGVQLIQARIARIVVAGGDENMSRQPYLDFAGRNGPRLGNRTMLDGTLSMLTDPFGGYQMGETAERVAERCGVTRGMQDAYAAESHRRAIEAIDDGRFSQEVVRVPLPDGTLFERDEHPRRGMTPEMLGKLSPAFRDEGTVTAGNSSGINDGAAAVVLMAASEAASRRLVPLLRFIDATVVGVEPEVMGYAPVPAVRQLLARTGLTVDDVDVVELNEAFAAQAIPVIRDLGLDLDRVNPNGGAIALGHPIGATGAILTVKLAYELRRRRGRFGLVTMCIGGGQGIAALFESWESLAAGTAARPGRNASANPI